MNDEKISNDQYVVDITIKNIGNKATGYVMGRSLNIQDEQGYFLERNDISPGTFGSTVLAAGDLLRGNVVFKVPSSGIGNHMIIWDSSDGYINSGTLSNHR